MGFIDVGDGAAGGAGDAADHSLRAALAEHFAGVGIVRMDDDSVRDVAAELGIGMSGWVEDLGVDAADAFFGIAGLDVGVAVFSDADSAHREEAGRGLGVGGAEAALAGAAAEGLLDFAGFERDDVHALGARVDDVDPSRVVAGMAGAALRGDGGFDLGPISGGNN